MSCLYYQVHLLKFLLLSRVVLVVRRLEALDQQQLLCLMFDVGCFRRFICVKSPPGSCCSGDYTWWGMCVCMVITSSKSIHQPGRVVIPARGQLSREKEFSLSPFAPENVVSRDGFGSRPVPRQPALLYTQAESGAYLRDSPRFPRRPPYIHLIYLNCQTPSGQSRVYRVTQLRTDGVNCRESAGTGPVNLKAVPNGCCLGRSSWTNSFPHPLLV